SSTWLASLRRSPLSARGPPGPAPPLAPSRRSAFWRRLARRREGLTSVGLPRRLLVTAGNLTGIVDRLHAEGLVRRAVHPADRRAFRLTLTPKGRRLVRRAPGRHHRALTALLADVPARDLPVLRPLLHPPRPSASWRAVARSK